MWGFVWDTLGASSGFLIDRIEVLSCFSLRALKSPVSRMNGNLYFGSTIVFFHTLNIEEAKRLFSIIGICALCMKFLRL